MAEYRCRIPGVRRRAGAPEGPVGRLPIGVVLLVVTVIIEEPLEVIDGGLNVAVAPAGKPLAFSVTVPVYPPDPIIVTV